MTCAMRTAPAPGRRATARWLAQVELGGGVQLTLLDYLGAIDALVVRRDALERAIAEQVPGSPWAEAVARLRCLRGIDTLSAVGLCAELGDFERFDRPARLMSYLGLVPSEDSSGERRHQGQITKTGSRHARRLLVEAAWHYRRRPARGTPLQRRQAGQSAHVLAIAWQAQQRPQRVWQRLDHERGKRRTIVAVAVAREPAGFCWAITRSRPDYAHDRTTSAQAAAGPPATTRERIRDLPLSTPEGTLENRDCGRSRPNPVLRQPTAHKSLTARRAPAGPAATSTDTGCPPQPRASGAGA